MLEWIRTHETLLWWLGASSVVTFVGTLVLVPWMVVRIPADYFAHRTRHKASWADQHPVIRWVLLIAKNLLGYVFILAGLAMLLLPGQGLLTLAVGIMLLDFPGKFEVERTFVSRGPVRRTINWLRVRAGRPELVFESDSQ
jgi:hypothetical protein